MFIYGFFRSGEAVIVFVLPLILLSQPYKSTYLCTSLFITLSNYEVIASRACPAG